MNNLKQYLEKHNFSKQLKNLKKKLKDKTVIIYGTGKLFQTIVENYDLSGLNIIAVTDKKYDFETEVKEEFGYPAIPVEYLRSYYADYVLVATQNYYPIMESLLNNYYSHKYLPLVETFTFFHVLRDCKRMQKHITFMGHTFVLPFSVQDKLLAYTELSLRNKLQQKLYDIARESSARYIINNMITAPSFDSSYDLLSYALKQVKNEGFYMEFGVFKGRSINHIAKSVPNKTIYGFDSFEGLPEAWDSSHLKSHFKMNRLPEVRENVKLIKGFFDQSLPKFMSENGEFKSAFIHCDSDLYSSAKTMFDNLKNTIQSGTVIVFDEYFNYPNWENGEYKAFQEFIKENNLKYKYLGYVDKDIISYSSQVAVQII